MNLLPRRPTCFAFVIAIDGWSGKAVYIERYENYDRALARKDEIDSDASQDKAFVVNTDLDTLQWLGPEALFKMHLRSMEWFAGFDDPPSTA
jgi:hypothetical protein